MLFRIPCLYYTPPDNSSQVRHHVVKLWYMNFKHIVCTFQDWQLTKPGLCDRGQYLLETGVWSDCQFIVGLSPNIRVSKIYEQKSLQVFTQSILVWLLLEYFSNFQIFRVHRMILAMSSPVFEAMFYGVLSDKEETVTILDVQPDAFYVMLQ